MNYLTRKDYTQQYLDFIRTRKTRCIIMTMARINPFFIANNIDIGYFDVVRVFPRSITERNEPLYLYKNPFCFNWKTQVVSFKKTREELKANFKVIDN